MDTTTILEYVKARLGISSNIRDTYLYAIIDSVIYELENEKGLNLDYENVNQLMFVVDFVCWRYGNKGEEKGTPRHLQFRLHNLIINDRGVSNA